MIVQGLVERDETVRSAREGALQAQRELQEQLSAETVANQDLQVRISVGFGDVTTL